MAKNGRFMVGLVGVAAVVTYLIWTGVSDTMVYYLTPTELEAKITADPTFKEVGVKVSGRVVPGSHWESDTALLHRFVIHDVDNPEVTMTIEYDNVLPDTFSDSETMTVDAVVEGRFREDGIFEATTVLTKCGSRYEATPEELAG
ncbi:MAG TPA: cytochrome c maturation protein CcmE [Longimicrobiales bacterium]|nr:cytochrome c maturation protein CcmE [Longimicrobiales bacterium]